MLRYPTLLLSLVALPTSVAPQADPLNRLTGCPDLAGAQIGVIVRDLGTGERIYEHRSDRGFMTASNMKLVTAATALLTLGPEFRYRTSLVGTRSVHDGVLDGDLVLIGSGDPSFGGRQETSRVAVFERMVDHLIERHGLRKIDGDILGDDDCQPDEVMGEGWSWGYQSDTYAAQVSGLCFAENVVSVHTRPGEFGGVPKVRFVPEPDDFFSARVEATTTAAGADSSLWVQRQRATNRIRVGGRIAADAKEITRRCSVENPTAFAAAVLRHTLRKKGIEVIGRSLDRDERPVRPDRYGDEVVLAEHESPPLHELLMVLIKASQNLYAEQLIRTASRVARGSGAMPSAAAHATETLRKLGVDPSGMRIADGSGLTRLNLVQPRQFAQLLAGMWTNEHRDVFMATLPVAGVDGTLRRRFKDTAAAHRVQAKTGYISSVVALSGYVTKPSAGPPIVFSILINNFTCPTAAAKRAVDEFVAALVPD